VAESAVISFPHSVKGEGLVGFVVLRESHAKYDKKTLTKELKEVIKMTIASYAVPDEVIVSFSPFFPSNSKKFKPFSRRFVSRFQKPGREKSCGDF
jgi:acyl-CoA synthetase (AMP-forming)/AMP-acid ligase II